VGVTGALVGEGVTGALVGEGEAGVVTGAVLIAAVVAGAVVTAGRVVGVKSPQPANKPDTNKVVIKTAASRNLTGSILVNI
jgi:hypothetical protein